MFIRLLSGFIFCYGFIAYAAPLPSPWEAATDWQIPAGTAVNTSQYNPYGILMTDELLAIGLTGDDLCGEVQVFSLSEGATVADGAPDWVLRPRRSPDSNSMCPRPDKNRVPNMFGAKIVMAGDYLVIADQNIPELIENPGGLGNRVYIYQAIRANGAIQDWSLQQIFVGRRDFGVIRFGDQLMSNGNQLFISGVLDIDNMFGVDTTRLFVLALGQNGQFELATQLEFNDNFVAFGLAGDQLIASGLHDGVNAILQFYNYDSKSPSLELAQEILNQELPSGSLGGLIQTSGDYAVGGLLEFEGINTARPKLAVFKRGAEDQWGFVQNIEAPLEFPSFSTFSGRVSFVLQGSDLIVNWLDTDTVGPLGFTGPILSEHYRLDADGRFRLFQDIELRLGHNQDQQRLRAVVSNTDHLAMVHDAAMEDVEIQFFSREQGTNYVINRGITGSWWFGPQRSGQGIFLEVLGPAERPRVLMHWDTHDNAGNQQWLRGAGEIDLDRVVMDLKRPVGGLFGPDFDPTTINRGDWGQAELVFTGCDTGSLHYSSDEFGTGVLPLFRITRIDGLGCGDALASITASRWSGSWADPAFDGQGFMLQVVESNNGPVMTGIWNTYSPDGSQAWLYADEAIVPFGNVFAPEIVTQAVGLTFETGLEGNQRIRIPWGNYVMRRTSCRDIELSYTSILPEYGSGTQNLRRITRPLGLRC